MMSNTYSAPDYPESWMLYLGYYGKYEISNHGNVREKKSKKNVDQTLASDGYCYAQLKSKDLARTVRIDQIVAEAYLGRCPAGSTIVHVDGHKNNNSIHNLEYKPIVSKKPKTQQSNQKFDRRKK